MSSEQEIDEVYRVEAEVLDENAAEVLKETIERVPECNLTAFDRMEVDNRDVEEVRELVEDPLFWLGAFTKGEPHADAGGGPGDE